jgi:NitT/TauT family transport system ATP-binding protein
MGTLILNATSQTAAGSRMAMTESTKAINPAATASMAGDPRSAGITMAIEDVACWRWTMSP